MAPQPEVDEFEHVPEDVATADIDAEAGVVEAIELYEAAARHYAAATFYVPGQVVTTSASTGLVET